jgi:amidase
VVFSITVPDALARIRAREPLIRAFVSTRLPEARREHEERAREAPRSAVHGVPFSLKDEWETLCLPTTGGSWRHRARRSPGDSRVARAFVDGGAILLGKTNLSDYGLAPESSSWVGGATRNPIDPSRTAGGSSGGAAAAVADGMVGFDWGTDIGGSIRLPAANCGVFGLRLSSETWPVTELFPVAPPTMAWMLAQGPITRTLAEMEAVLDVAAPRLAASAGDAGWTPRAAALHAPAVLGRWPGFHADAAAALRRVLGDVLPAEGLEPTRRAQRIYGAVWCSHLPDLVATEPEMGLAGGLAAVISALLLRGRLGDRRFHPITAEILIQVALGGAIFRDRARALAGARRIQEGFRRLWARGQVVVMPVCAFPAARVGRSNLNPRILECNLPGNLADATSLVVPWGRFPDGLPRALQLMGPPGSERRLIELAGKLLDRATMRGCVARSV